MTATEGPPTLGPLFLVTRRLEPMADFYGAVVGLPASRRDPGHHVWYDAGGVELVLHAPDPEPGPSFTPRDTGALLWFAVDEPRLHAAQAAARRSWGPYDGGARTLLYTLDPDENMVGLYAPRP